MNAPIKSKRPIIIQKLIASYQHIFSNNDILNDPISQSYNKFLQLMHRQWHTKQ